MKWLQKNKEFIKDLQSCSFLYSHILNQDDIVCAYLAGSRSSGLIDERSDYDLVVVTLNSPSSEEPIFSMTYGNASVHWYYRSIDELLYDKSRKGNTLSYFSGINLKFIEDHTIYINSKYQRYYNWIVQNKREIILYNCWEFVLSNPVFVNVCGRQSVTPANYSKFLYHLCHCAYIIFARELEVEFLIKLKRIKYTQDSSLAPKTYELIKELDDYRKNNDIQRKERRKQLYDSLSKIKEEVN